MTQFKVDTDIPLPARGMALVSKYPFMEMEVGHSFLVPPLDGENIAFTRSRVNTAAQYAKRAGRTFATRTVEGGIRVWRLS